MSFRLASALALPQGLRPVCPAGATPRDITLAFLAWRDARRAFALATALANARP